MSGRSFRMASFSWLSAALVVCGCAGSPVTEGDLPGDSADNPAEWGPYAVGYRKFDTSDAMRGDRQVPLAVYYPASGVPITADTVVPCDAETAFEPRAVSTADAAPAAGGPFPVLVFSHGSGASKEMYKYLLEFLASHGYVCVAPDHTGNVGFMSMMPEDMEMTSLRVTDMLWVIDWLGSAAGDEAGPLNGLVDMNRLAVAGHSYGGHVVMALGGAAWDWDHIALQCAMDEPPDPYVCSLANHTELWGEALPSDKVKAVVSLAHDASTVHFGGDCVGTGTVEDPGTLGAATIGVPVMYVGGTSDTIAVFDDNAKLCYDHGSSPACLVKLDGAGHLDFTDLMAEGSMSCDRAHFIVRAMVLAFLDRNLLGAEAVDSPLSGDRGVWADASDLEAVCR